LWQEYKEHVGEFHWTPQEAFALAFPGAGAGADELSVVSWILPQTGATRADHRGQREFPAERWARARIMGEGVNDALREHVTAVAAQNGVQACAPILMPEWSRMDSDRFVFASKWSERHAAYAAGNGTFGLCDGLITPVGKSMRAGSAVIRLKLAATQRPYSSHREYCLHFNSGICGKCAKRCPANALSVEEHDKRRCFAYVRGVTAPYVKERYHFDGYGCGFCQVGVPCESGIPPRPRKAR
jgi:epoxyqueuosine reductase QueG